ncbi:phage tail protein [Streptomyces huasconensis]|uniref:phage tail protein n=1 Tax=Streptomyces huasconensis TaxID=1854574 RepID=UPI0036FE6624
MALHLGELVAGLRADDSGFVRGLNNARLRMEGLTRDVNGRLRDLRGRFVSEGDAAGRALGDRISAGARQAVNAVRRVGPAVAGVAVGLPAVAAATTALMGLAAGAAAAGLAVKAFSLAAGPQLEAVTEVSKLAEEAQKAVAAGAEDAAEKQKAYKDALAELPPATQATARAFIGLKSDYKAWSDEMSGTTMPLFTKGIEILRDLLPSLTPFVRAAAGAIGDFLDEVAVGVKSAGFKEWAADMSSAAGPALRNFLAIIKNLAIGFAGLLRAFLPVSDGVTGGLVQMSEAFADWGSSLPDSEAFAAFLETAGEGGAALGALAGAAVDLLVALAPLIGLTAQLATWLASIISATPTPVLTALAVAIGTVTLAMKAWAVAQAIVAARNAIWTATQWQLNAAMFASPIFWVVAAIAALIAIIVLIATKTTWLQTAWSAAWNFIKAATDVAIAGIKTAIAWFAGLPALISGWFGAAKDAAVRQFTALVGWLRGLPARAGAALAGLAGSLRTAAVRGFTAFKSAAAAQASAFLGWVRGLPRRIASAIGSLSGLLVSKGKDVVRGLWNGIKSMGSWLKSTLISWAKSIIPGPIARALDIGSPSRLMADQVGHWIPSGIAMGAEANSGVLDKTMSSLVSTPTPSAAMAMGAGVTGTGGTAGGGRAPQVVTLRSDGSGFSDLVIGTLRDAIGARGGNVQFVLGR